MVRLALLLGICSLAVPSLAAAPRKPLPQYRLIRVDIPSSFGIVYDLNERRQAVGHIGTTRDSIPFVWSPDSLETFADLEGWQFRAIDEEGTIVGQTPDGGEAFVWRRGLGEEPVMFNPFGADEDNTAVAINGAGVIAGTAPLPEDIGNNTRAFVWEGGEARRLDDGDARSSFASGINDRGQVVGATLMPPYQATLWDGETVEFFTGFNFAIDINNAGQIVGSRLLGNQEEAVLKDGGLLRGLGFLSPQFDGAIGSVATDINAHAEVVGLADVQRIDDRAFYWSQDHGMLNLNDLIVDGRDEFLYLWQCGDINDRGDIAGTGRLPNGFFDAAFVALRLNPVPAEIVVDSLDDSGPGSLRQAVADFEPGSGAVITFAPELSREPATIALTSGELVLPAGVTIEGPPTPGRISLDANSSSRVVSVVGAEVTLRSLYLLNGKLDSGSGAGVRVDEGASLTLDHCGVFACQITGGAGAGAGVYADGNLTLIQSEIGLNTVESGNGAGIAFSGAELEISGSAVFSNTIAGGASGRGAGIQIAGGSGRIRNSTLSGNRAGGGGGRGGAIAIDGAEMDLSQLTIARNHSDDGGAVFVESSVLKLSNSLIAGNTGGAAGEGDVRFGAAVDFTGNGGSLFGSPVPGMPGEGVLAGPLEAAINRTLLTNGGVTRSHAPVASGPLVDAGVTLAEPPETDQRGFGFPRVQGGGIDVGAVEHDLREAATLEFTSDNNPSNIGDPVRLMVVPTPNDISHIVIEGFGRVPLVGAPGSRHAMLDISSLSGGENTLRAFFEGNAEFRPAAATLVQTVLPDEVDISMPSTIAEGGEGVARVRRGRNAGDLTVLWMVDPGATAQPEEYEIIAGGEAIAPKNGVFELVIPDGATTIEVTLRMLPDLLAEDDEEFRLRLIETGDYEVSGRNPRRVTIPRNGFLVTNANPRGEGSLRQAIDNANHLRDGPFEITFSDALGTPFSSEPQTIPTDGLLIQIRPDAELTIRGPQAPGRVTVDADFSSNVFWLTNFGDPITLENLTIARGRNTSSTALAGGVHVSGGVRATLRNVTVRDCVNAGPAGIEVGGRSTVDCFDCAFIGNESLSGVGGGIHFDGVELTMVNCTVSGNSTQGQGGAGIYIQRGDQLSLFNVTITENVASVFDPAGGGVGIGGERSGSQDVVSIANTIVAGNRYLQGAQHDILGEVESLGHNIIGAGDGASGFTGDDTVGTIAAPIDAGLLPLRANGENPPAHPLRAESIALDAGLDSAIPEGVEFDGRGAGFPRIVGDAVDIGATEIQQVISLAAEPSAIVETDAPQAVTLTLLREGDLSLPLELDWLLRPESSFVAGGAQGQVAFAAETSSANITAQLRGDNLAEADERFTLQLVPGLQEVGFGANLRGAVFDVTDDDAVPVAAADGPFELVEDSVFSVPGPGAGVLENDTDADDATLVAALVTPPGNAAAFTLRPDGTFTYEPQRDFLGSDQFTYSASDGTNSSGNATVSLSVVPLVDLEVTAAESVDPVFAGLGLPENLRHTIIVTNRGPSDATDITVRLGGSAGASTLQIPRLAEGQSKEHVIPFDIAADAPGPEPVVTRASVTGLDQPLTETEDDSASVTTTVVSAAQIHVTGAGAPALLERQSGLFEQRVSVTNNNSGAVPAARLWISGLPGGTILHNATGRSESGAPYIDILSLGAGDSLMLSLEFFAPKRDASGLEPEFRIELIEPVPSAVADDAFAIDRVLPMGDGGILIEWTSTPGLRYAVQYSDDGRAWQGTGIPVLAVANRTQWIDGGPPKTRPHPGQSGQRFYRVVEIGAAEGR